MKHIESKMLFELEQVTKRYGRLVALSQLTVQIPPGAVGLLGPNGSGKTTLIRVLMGLIRLTAGHGRILGMDIQRDQLRIRQAVGLMPEEECLFPRTDAVEFVAYAGELVGMPARAAMQRAHEVLDYVSIHEERYRPVEGYSTGMKQRLKLAAALIHDPQLLILDEPTNGMDPKGRHEMLTLIQILARDHGKSLVFSSHLLPDVEAVCDYVLVLRQGRLLSQGRIQDLKEIHQQVVKVRLKENQNQFAQLLQQKGIAVNTREDRLELTLPEGWEREQLWSLAAAHGLQIRFLRPRRNTLEEVFLKAVAAPSDSNEVAFS